MHWQSVKFRPAKRPMHPVGHEVEPYLLGDDASLIHHLQGQALPAGQMLVIKRRAIVGGHHLTGKTPEKLEKRDMDGLSVVVPVAPCRLAGARQIGRIAAWPSNISVSVPPQPVLSSQFVFVFLPLGHIEIGLHVLLRQHHPLPRREAGFPRLRFVLPRAASSSGARIFS